MVNFNWIFEFLLYPTIRNFETKGLSSCSSFPLSTSIVVGNCVIPSLNLNHIRGIRDVRSKLYLFRDYVHVPVVH